MVFGKLLTLNGIKLIQGSTFLNLLRIFLIIEKNGEKSTKSLNQDRVSNFSII